MATTKARRAASPAVKEGEVPPVRRRRRKAAAVPPPAATAPTRTRKKTTAPAKKTAAEKRTPKPAIHPKAQAFRDAAEGHGWTTEHKVLEDGSDHLTCTRGKEVLVIWWLDGVYQRWATHTYSGGKPVRVPNAKSGLRVLEATPQEASSQAVKKAATARRTAPRGTVSVNGAVVTREGMSAEEKFKLAMTDRDGSMPWDDLPEEGFEDATVEVLSGRKITFASKATGNVTSAGIPAKSKHTAIKYGKDGPYVTFASMEGPFMNISLSRILHVS